MMPALTRQGHYATFESVVHDHLAQNPAQAVIELALEHGFTEEELLALESADRGTER